MRKYSMYKSITTVYKTDVFADHEFDAILEAEQLDDEEWGDVDHTTTRINSAFSTSLDYELYDNGGRTMDRYTLVIPDLNECITMSSDPTAPNGVMMSTSTEYANRDHLGTPISINSVPAKVREAVEDWTGGTS